MILVDSSKWIDHLRQSESVLTHLLTNRQVLSHPFVIGELAMGNLNPRDSFLHILGLLPEAVVARNDEVLRFVAHHKLFGLGIGYVDAHLLVAVQLTPGAKIWTRDKRLLSAAQSLHLVFIP